LTDSVDVSDAKGVAAHDFRDGQSRDEQVGDFLGEHDCAALRMSSAKGRRFLQAQIDPKN